MTNITLGIICTILAFIGVVVVERLFKKEGLFVWIAMASVLANIYLVKTVGLAGITASLGNILFASNYLCTDILSEKYGAKYSKKAVNLGFVAVVIFLVSSQLALAFVPDTTDVMQPVLEQLFTLTLRVSAASVFCYWLSNHLDVWLFEKIKAKTGGKHMWLRNNVSTIVSNCGENFLFYTLAFIGIMDMPLILSLAGTASVIEILIALCDTPFLYLSKKLDSKTLGQDTSGGALEMN